eukprot:jgi/Botrbrau1/5780/Bobra.0155s0003.1
MATQCRAYCIIVLCILMWPAGTWGASSTTTVPPPNKAPQVIPSRTPALLSHPGAAHSSELNRIHLPVPARPITGTATPAPVWLNHSSCTRTPPPVPLGHFTGTGNSCPGVSQPSELYRDSSGCPARRVELYCCPSPSCANTSELYRGSSACPARLFERYRNSSRCSAQPSDLQRGSRVPVLLHHLNCPAAWTVQMLLNPPPCFSSDSSLASHPYPSFGKKFEVRKWSKCA